MQSDWYTLLSMGMRYWFTALAAVIVLRAWRATIRDTRRARVLRAWAPDTGAIGEIVVCSGGDGIRKGSRIPLPKEGLMGSSRRSDVRLKHPSVRRYHAHIEQRENGVLMEPLGKSKIMLGGRTGGKLLLRDGDRFSIGRISLMLVLYGTPGAEVDISVAEDDLFSPAGLGAAKSAPKAPPKRRNPVDFMEENPPSKPKKAKKVPAADELFMPFEEEIIFPKSKKTSKKKTIIDEVDWWQDGRP